MKITVICVGKIKEKFYSQAINEYSKRLSKYCSLSIIEVADEKTDESASLHEASIIKSTEGERILKNISEKDYVIALCIDGKPLDSVKFANYIEKLSVDGNSNIVFVIGGSLGLGGNVLARADYKLSFSNMTFPHQLMRVILLEQIYRCFRIIKNEPYHK